MTEGLKETVYNAVNEMGPGYNIRNRRPNPHTNCFLCPETREPISTYEVTEQSSLYGIPVQKAMARIYSQPVRGNQLYVEINNPSIESQLTGPLQSFAEESGLNLSIDHKF